METQIISFGENKASVKQSSSGFWYTNELTICCTSIMDGLVLLDRAVFELNKILNKYNKDGKEYSFNTKEKK